ncbi:MAG: amino acid permease [Actinomycetales bacterium]|nr:amino acid permease [Actinomycetales bacterium]
MSRTQHRTSGIGVPAAIALGVGAMMGSGIFTLLGLAGRTSGPLIPVAFVVAAFAASFSVYSYARLGGAFPSRGGAAGFLRAGLGSGILSGGFNVFQFLGYLFATALYAAGFAEYAQVMVGRDFPDWARPTTAVMVVVVFGLVNLFGTRFTVRAELITVAVTVVILVLLAVIGAVKADPAVLAEDALPALTGVLTAAGLLYVNYQGFGVVTNAADQMSNPRRQLPRAMFTALAVVALLYLALSTVTVLVLPVSAIEADSTHVLASVATAVAGPTGFTIIVLAAILASAAAVNATIFAAANIAADVAQHGQLPQRLARSWGPMPVALLFSMALVILLVMLFPLAAIGQMTSLAFLLVYAAVSAAHLRLRDVTGSAAWPLVVAIVLNAILFVTLIGDAIATGPATTWLALVLLLASSFGFAWLYHRQAQHRT